MTPITLETYPGSRKKGLINLIECGYNTLEMVSETDDDVLLRYRNVGPVLIADLRKMAMDHGIQITGKPTKPSYKRLERENAALRADKARLDWLERRTVSRLQAVLDHVELHKLPIREAIDLAIEEIGQ